MSLHSWRLQRETTQNCRDFRVTVGDREIRSRHYAATLSSWLAIAIALPRLASPRLASPGLASPARPEPRLVALLPHPSLAAVLALPSPIDDSQHGDSSARKQTQRTGGATGQQPHQQRRGRRQRQWSSVASACGGTELRAAVEGEQRREGNCWGRHSQVEAATAEGKSESSGCNQGSSRSRGEAPGDYAQAARASSSSCRGQEEGGEVSPTATAMQAE